MSNYTLSDAYDIKCKGVAHLNLSRAIKVKAFRVKLNKSLAAIKKIHVKTSR